MTFLKSILFLSMILSPGFINAGREGNVVKWVITSVSSLKVNGSTNVNKFSCIIPQYDRPDTLSCRQNSIGSLKLSGGLNLTIADFNCHNPVMTKDLRKTLRAKDYPEMKVKFISLSRYPDLNSKSDEITGIVIIELAGVLKRFEVNYRFIPGNDKSLTLIGSRQINFSDFNITPPKKLGGAIKTYDELSVEFNLKMRVLD